MFGFGRKIIVASAIILALALIASWMYPGKAKAIWAAIVMSPVPLVP